MTTIAEQVNAMRATRPGGRQADPFEVEQRRLAAEGAPGGVLPVGSRLSDIELLDVDGDSTTFFSALAGKTAVLFSTAALGVRTATSPCGRTNLSSSRRLSRSTPNWSR
jgi:hypothetical protein